jgi:DMSO/TMAO reductase YedYZ heme-binding membrane subunit
MGPDTRWLVVVLSVFGKLCWLRVPGVSWFGLVTVPGVADHLRSRVIVIMLFVSCLVTLTQSEKLNPREKARVSIII